MTRKMFGPYEIMCELGRGGMGKVYKAHHNKLQRTVALKTIISNSPTQIQRFMVEARATAQLNHPNIVRLYEVGELGGIHFFTMDYIAGNNLKTVIQNRKLTIKKSIAIVLKIAEAIQYAHQHNIIHRDLKPANIMLNSDGIPFVMDFGLAKVLSDEEHLTQTGVIIGSLAYMPPEQAEGKHRQIDARSDIYSLGVILYECLCGQKPFSGTSPAATLVKIMTQVPAAPSTIKPRIPKRLDEICLCAMAKSQKNRYQNVKDFINDLENYDKKSFSYSKKFWVTITTLLLFFSFMLYFNIHKQKPNKSNKQPTNSLSTKKIIHHSKKYVIVGQTIVLTSAKSFTYDMQPSHLGQIHTKKQQLLFTPHNKFSQGVISIQESNQHKKIQIYILSPIEIFVGKNYAHKDIHVYKLQNTGILHIINSYRVKNTGTFTLPIKVQQHSNLFFLSTNSEYDGKIPYYSNTNTMMMILVDTTSKPYYRFLGTNRENINANLSSLIIKTGTYVLLPFKGAHYPPTGGFIYDYHFHLRKTTTALHGKQYLWNNYVFLFSEKTGKQAARVIKAILGDKNSVNGFIDVISLLPQKDSLGVLPHIHHQLHPSWASNLIGTQYKDKQIFIYDEQITYKVIDVNCEVSPTISHTDSSKIVYAEENKIMQVDLMTGNKDHILHKFSSLQDIQDLFPSGKGYFFTAIQQDRRSIFVWKPLNPPQKIFYSKPNKNYHSPTTRSPEGAFLAAIEETQNQRARLLIWEKTHLPQPIYSSEYWQHDKSKHWLSFSPSGKKLVYSKRIDGKWKVCIVNIRQNFTKTLTNSASCKNPQFITENILLYLSDISGEYKLYYYDIQNDHQTLFLDINVPIRFYQKVF